MVDDVQRLGLAVDSSEVKEADSDLKKLGNTAVKTEKKTDGMVKKLNKNFNVAGSAVDRFKNKTRVASQKIVEFMGRVRGSVVSMAGRVNAVLASTAAKFAALGAVAALTAESIAGFNQSLSRSAALFEVSTLIEGTAAEMSLLSSEADKLRQNFGGGLVPQIEGFYQAFSAGAGTIKEASSLLFDSNNLAVAGATNVGTALDILTAATDVYGKENITTAGAADALFVAMQRGKTKIGELGGSMGKVLPLAEKLGVNFDTVAAATAALTKSGISTAESITGLKAIFAGILKPTKEASDLATKLGIDFSVAGLKSMELAGFLEHLKDKTGGNSEQMAILFGNLEAVIPALSLMGKGGEFLIKILKDMDDKTGAVDAAMEKWEKSLSGRHSRAMAKFQSKAEELSNAMTAKLVPVLEVLANNIERISSYLKTGAVGLALYVAGTTAYALATGTATVATVALGFALKAIPFVLVFVVISELIFQFGKLVKASGGFGNAMKLLKNVALESLDRMGIGLDFLGSKTKEVSNYMVFWFASGHAKMGKIFSDWVNKIRGPLAGLSSWLSGGKKSKAAFLSEIGFVEIGAGLQDIADKALDSKDAAARAAQEFLHLATRPLDSLKVLNKTVEDNKKETEAAAAATNDLSTKLPSVVDGLKKTGKEAKETANAFEERLTGAVKSLSDAFADFVTRGFKDFKRFAENIKDTFKSLLRDLISQAVKNKILISLGFDDNNVRSPGRRGVGNTVVDTLEKIFGGGRSRGGNAIDGSIKPPLRGDRFKNGTDVLSRVTGGAGGAGGGGIGIGGIISGASSVFSLVASGFGALATNIGAGIIATFGTAAAGFVGAASAAIAIGGPIVLGIAALAIAFKGIFKGTKRITDTKLDISFNDDSVSARKGTTTRTKKWFRGPKYNTAYSDVDAEFLGVLNKFNTDSRKVLSDLGATFGEGDALEGFSHKVKFSTFNKSQDEINNQLKAELEAVSEAMAQRLVGGFKKEGETFKEAAQRLAQSIVVVNATFGTLGLKLFDISRAGAAAASGLVDILGGIQGFNSATEFYFRNFFSATEQTKINVQTLSKTLELLGINEIPKSRIAFRGLVQEMQEIGNTNAVGTLLKIAPLFIEISRAAEEAARANERLFKTRADQVYATSGAVQPYVAGRPIADPETVIQQRIVATLREILHEARNGNITNAQNTGKTARTLDRMLRGSESGELPLANDALFAVITTALKVFKAKETENAAT